MYIMMILFIIVTQQSVEVLSASENSYIYNRTKPESNLDERNDDIIFQSGVV